MIDSIISDEVKKGDQAAADDLRQGATLYRALSEGFKSVQFLLSCSAEEVADFLAAHVMLCDPAFHDLLDLRARLAIRNDELGDAQNIRGAREYLISICRLVHRASELPKAAIDGKDNFIRWPSSSEQAEMWFLMSREFSETCINLAQKVVIGEQPLDAAVTAACCAFSQQMEERKRIPIVHAIAAFYEFVLMTDGVTPYLRRPYAGTELSWTVRTIFRWERKSSRHSVLGMRKHSNAIGENSRSQYHNCVTR